MIRSKALAYEVHRAYSAGKKSLYDHVMQDSVVSFAKDNKRGSPSK